MNKYQKSLIDFMKTGKIEMEIELRNLSQRELIRLVEEIQERLNNENKQYTEYIKELKDSLMNYHIKNNKLINKNERLNNIINELENFIKTYSIPEFTLNEPPRLFMETKIILDKLQELKEGK